MKARILTLAAAVAAVALIGACSSPQPVDIDSMSLEKTSPFATPSPKPFTMERGPLSRNAVRDAGKDSA